MSTNYVATIGSFDGVHRGHQALLHQVLKVAGERSLKSAVITFDRQPRQLFDSSFRPQLLSTLQEKEALLKALGIDRVVVLPFDRALAVLSARDFMQQVLSEKLQVKVLVTGYDNRFGHDRREGFDDYVAYGRELGIDVMRGDMEPIPGSQQAVSSSVIRQLLSEGQVERMPDCLTRFYSLTGRVVAGEHIGHELGFPTANLEPDSADKLIPSAGVYAVRAKIDAEWLPGMMNIGMRPTFDGRRQTLEVNLFSPIGDVYGRQLTVEFVARLRSERRFESREALMQQLQADKVEALRILTIEK